MIIGNAKVFANGSFFDGYVEIENGLIKKVEKGNTDFDVDAKEKYLVPGFIDVHTHGALNEDFSDGNLEGILKMSKHYAKCGVTSFLATTMTLKEDTLTKAMKAIKAFERPSDGAKCAGVHLEGPFVSYAKRGAQAAENLHKPDVEMFKRLNDAVDGQVKLITIAPEEDGAIPFIEEVSKICTVSLGHTTADYETAMKAYKAGASHATHLYNAMPPLHHRDSGVIGAAFDSGATVELICDGLHIHPSTIRLTHKMFGDRLVIISDSLRCAGMPDGEYELGGQPIEMKNGKATLKGTDTLAGSSSNLLQELKNVVSFGVPLEDALTSLTIAPAKAVKIDNEIGSIAVGKKADLLILDDDLNLDSIYINGNKIN